MKAKVFIPITIIAAGAVTGIALGLSNIGSGGEKKAEVSHTEISQETTLSEEELAKIEEQKEKEYEEKVKEEEANAAEFFKKRQEEKQKKEEEEKKKKEEEEKQKKTEGSVEESTDNKENETTEGSAEAYGDETEYEYVYAPVEDNSSGSYNNSSGSNNSYEPTTTRHTHSWQAVYRTVHHNAQTHNEKKQVGTVEYTECNHNGDLFFSLTTEYADTGFYQVCKLSNGDLVFETNKEDEKKEISYFMNLMNISAEDETYAFATRVEEVSNDVTVTDREAYDEEIFDHYICTGCGQTSY